MPSGLLEIRGPTSGPVIRFRVGPVTEINATTNNESHTKDKRKEAIVAEHALDQLWSSGSAKLMRFIITITVRYHLEQGGETCLSCQPGLQGNDRLTG